MRLLQFFGEGNIKGATVISAKWEVTFLGDGRGNHPGLIELGKGCKTCGTVGDGTARRVAEGKKQGGGERYEDTL